MGRERPTSGFGVLFSLLREAMEWLARLLWLNLLWIAFSCLGLVVLGVWPATAAMFRVARGWARDGSGGPVAVEFWRTYRREFWRSNLLGGILTGCGVVLYVDIRLTAAATELGLRLLEAPLLAAAGAYLVTLLYVWPAFAHYETGTLNYLRLAFVIGVCRPLHTLAMALSVLALGVVTVYLQGASMLVGAAFAAVWLTWLFNRATLSSRLNARVGSQASGTEVAGAAAGRSLAGQGRR